MARPPTAVRSNGAYRLYYEINVANYTEEQLKLESVEIQIGAQNATLAGDALARQTVSYGVSIPPTKSGVVLIGLSMTSEPPESLRHRVTFSSAGRTSTLETQALPVLRNPVRIAPPLRGDHWWAGAGPDSGLHHRAAILPMAGRFTIAQRFAFDFARRVPGSGDFERGDRRKLESSPSYGAEVLAVADATVTLARGDVPDAPPYEIAPPYPITKETLGGNLVVLDLGRQRWAVYAHLIPGSLRVKPGDRVRQGDVIARLGNSASYSPHLHFHVVDGPDQWSSEGVPFVFDEFTHEGKLHRDEMPAGGWTIDFAPPSTR
jgi:murein DD-endopeptidase MepM/ murein hydrolase activator NlpD